MQSAIEFNLTEKLKQWEDDLAKSPVVTIDDRDMLKDHLMNLVEKYVQLGNTEEEAFVLALHKLGDKSSWEDTFADVNSSILELKRAATFFGGVFFYFLLYLFVLVIDRAMLYIGGRFEIEIIILYQISKYYLQIISLITIFGIIALVMNDIWFSKFIHKILLSPLRIVSVFILIILLSIFDRILDMLVKGVLKYDLRIYMRIDHSLDWFQYLFPLIFAGGFLAIYWRYFNNAKSDRK